MNTLSKAKEVSRSLPSEDYCPITANDVGKRYIIYNHPADRLKEMLSLTGKMHGREFWALKNVSFEVKRGEALGIIGRNGAGKSTLLQILCGTLAPTNGVVKITGRIAALLELGSGFNPEFSGKENVFLNASVLGLSHAEIVMRYDKIVAFADIGEFIHSPVKIYSSGMMVRLAFAVVAHVDADILVVDEALAVGDAVFTQKCMRFIREFRERGTLLFVSHDTNSVNNLCSHAMWLDKGEVRMIGESTKVSEEYLRYTLQETYGTSSELKAVSKENPDQSSASKNELKGIPLQVAEIAIKDNLAEATGWLTGAAELESIEFTRLDSIENGPLKGGEMVVLTIRSKANVDLPCPILGFTVRDRLGQELFGENTLPFTDKNPRCVGAGTRFFAQFTFRLPMLPNGDYALMASVADGTLYKNTQHHWLGNALILTVSSSTIRWGLVGIEFKEIVMESIES